jgi:hypothetical protein
MDRRPDLPSYTTFLTGHRFYDEFEAQSCRFEVEDSPTHSLQLIAR